MGFSDIAKKALSMTGPMGLLAAKASDKLKEGFQNGQYQNDQQTIKLKSETSPITYLVWALMIGVSVYLHFKCNEDSFDIGVIPAILCPSCYLLFYFGGTKNSCPSEIKKLVMSATV